MTRPAAVFLTMFAFACGGSVPTAPPPGSQTMAPAATLTPALAGTWRGSYFIVGEISGSDGTMTWSLQQDGSVLTGSFTIQKDLALGNVSGTVTGRYTPAAGTTPNHYDVSLNSSSVSGFPGCTLVLSARQFSVPATPSELFGSYKQTLCGRTSNLENGTYQLRKQ